MEIQHGVERMFGILDLRIHCLNTSAPHNSEFVTSTKGDENVFIFPGRGSSDVKIDTLLHWHYWTSFHVFNTTQ